MNAAWMMAPAHVVSFSGLSQVASLFLAVFFFFNILKPDEMLGWKHTKIKISKSFGYLFLLAQLGGYLLSGKTLTVYYAVITFKLYLLKSFFCVDIML